MNDWNAALHGRSADLHLILIRVLAGRGVDDGGHVLVLHEVDDIGGLAAGGSRDDVHGDADFGDDAAGATGGHHLVAEVASG